MLPSQWVRTVLLAIMTAFITMGASAAERVYKWVDADGVVQFGQQPPTTTDSEAIRIQKGFSVTDRDTEREPSDEEKKAAADAETCRIATENFDKLSGENDVQRTDEYGETHILSAEEKASERARAAAAMQRYCP